jgi:hypothetical protein
LIILAVPNSNVASSSLEIRYKLDGRVMPWYWQLFFKELNPETPEGKRMFILLCIVAGCIVLCWLTSVGVCLRHCLCRHLLPDICGYAEDFAAEEVKLRDMMI